MSNISEHRLFNGVLLNVQRIVLTLWIGGLWAVGYLVAPVLFHQLQNPQVAGIVAGELFTLMSWIGLASALILVVIYSFIDREKWRFIVILFISALVAINLFYLSPEIIELRGLAGGAFEKGTEIHNRFALLHGIASGVYLLVSLLGLLLVIRQPDKLSAARLIE